MKKNIIALLTISLILFCFFIDVYAECISGNCVNGYGISTITTSDNVEWKYEGKFKDGNHDGNGILYYNGKEFYDGQWKDGQRHGQGIWYYPNGKKFYEGQFKEDKKNGQGIQYDENGVKVYEGQWKDDNPLNADVVESKKDDIKQKTDCINIITDIEQLNFVKKRI